jgi:type I restriction enzyme S subunit
MSHALKPYPEYKDSGVPWLGKVPAHWTVLPHRGLFHEVNERNHPDEPLLSVTIARGVIPQGVLLADSSKKDSSNLDKSNYKLVQPGDITYNKMRAWQGAVGISQYRGIVSPAYIVVRPRRQQMPEYYHYLLRTPAFITEAERWSYGITSDMWSLRSEDFKRIYSVLPPYEEQRAIARFLDRHDRITRRYIRAQRRLIELLTEQKQALIQRAVTRGLDPDVPLKASGIPWLITIPAHWEVVRLKSVARIRYGLGQPPREAPNGLPLIRATNVKSGQIVEKGMIYVDPEDVPPTRDALLRQDEIIVVRSGALTADSAIIPKEYDGAVAGYDMVVTVHLENPRFIAAALLSRYLLDHQLFLLKSRAAQPHLNAEELGNAIVLVPPRAEQDHIAHYLDQATTNIAVAIDRAQCQIALIREYHTRLIADVVTGKLDVRQVAAHLLEGTEEPEELVEDEAEEEGDKTWA